MMNSIESKKLIDTVKKFLDEKGKDYMNYIYVYENSVCQAGKSFADPRTMIPGVFAVTRALDCVFISCGGDDFNGALRWEPVELAQHLAEDKNLDYAHKELVL